MPLEESVVVVVNQVVSDGEVFIFAFGVLKEELAINLVMLLVCFLFVSDIQTLC